MTNPLSHQSPCNRSESILALRRMGKKGVNRGGAIRDDIHASETKFWSACKLNPDGTRSNIPRDRSQGSEVYVQRSITPDMVRWLRENT